MARHRRLQQASEKHSDVAEHHDGQRRQHERTRAVTPVASTGARRALQHDAGDNRDGQQSEGPA